MRIQDAAVIRNYASRQEAEMAVLELASCGVEASLVTDDAGGAYPFLDLANGVAVIVDKSKESEAKSILAQANNTDNTLSTATESSSSSTKAHALLLGVLLGAVVASVAWWSYMHWYDNSKRGIYSKKGKLEETYYYHRGLVDRVERDRNGDGKPDEWFTYNAGICEEGEQDNNFDGEVDAWSKYSESFGGVMKVDLNYDGTPDEKIIHKNGLIKEILLDADFNGVFDYHEKYTNGIISLVEVSPNGTNVLFRREIYKNGVLNEEWIDEDMNGAFDVKKVFDPMGREISVTRLTK